MKDDANVMALSEKLAGLARRGHYYCEDTWFSCPKSEEGCSNDGAGDECDCGADEHNAEVSAVYAELGDALRSNGGVCTCVMTKLSRS